jgi:hypothetical protein
VSAAACEIVSGIAHDREPYALDIPCLAAGIDERRQICTLPQLPVHLGDCEAIILEKAGALLQRAGEKRHIARRVEERLGVGAATIGHIQQQCAVARAAGMKRTIFAEYATRPRSLRAAFDRFFPWTGQETGGLVFGVSETTALASVGRGPQAFCSNSDCLYTS